VVFSRSGITYLMDSLCLFQLRQEQLLLLRGISGSLRLLALSQNVPCVLLAGVAVLIGLYATLVGLVFPSAASALNAANSLVLLALGEYCRVPVKDSFWNLRSKKARALVHGRILPWDCCFWGAEA